MKVLENWSFMLFILLMVTTSCKEKSAHQELSVVDSISGKELEVPAKALREKVLTAEEQAALTPDQVIDSLRSGNRRFVHNDLTLRNHTEMVRKSASGQYPKAVVLSCMDSRVPVADMFDKGIGDMFVLRVAGNFANTDMLGSMEYGCKVSGAKVILVLGHQSCGAIKAAIGNYQLGNITAMLKNIKPSVDLSKKFEGDKTDKNKAYVELVTRNNVLNTIQEIRKRSPILDQMEKNGQIKIIGGYYNTETGVVTIL
ncbi:carbonic anhydrase family protein [Mucilaginibacter sp.]|uniref:carbonic anhydrase family protein n=1 Tax=Mucilaginibacter sp. TaxID=1882438 RepID=UPI0025F35111|nr:carbonic anhydrase family protein [Mucilaginibacter sp.]